MDMPRAGFDVLPSREAGFVAPRLILLGLILLSVAAITLQLSRPYDGSLPNLGLPRVVGLTLLGSAALLWVLQSRGRLQKVRFTSRNLDRWLLSLSAAMLLSAALVELGREEHAVCATFSGFSLKWGCDRYLRAPGPDGTMALFLLIGFALCAWFAFVSKDDSTEDVGAAGPQSTDDSLDKKAETKKPEDLG